MSQLIDLTGQRFGKGTKLIDITGQRFGKLTVIEKAKVNPCGGGAYWVCKCDCGNEHTANSRYLRLGVTKCCTECRQSKLKKEKPEYPSKQYINERIKILKELGVKITADKRQHISCAKNDIEVDRICRAYMDKVFKT